MTFVFRRSLDITRTILVLAALAAAPGPLGAQRERALPDALTDREFWQLFTTMSEESGAFPSENFVSNEKTYQYVIPSLQHAPTPKGVYLGVGPEQNFTYIVNLEPRLAVIVDIRRQNALLHLMYKALFELSPSRPVFVSRLFSRPLPPFGATVTAAAMFDTLAVATVSDSAFAANWKAIVEQLTVTHGFALSAEDIASMRRVFEAFRDAGPGISYAYRPGSPPPTVTQWFVTYAQLQTLTNADSVNMAFLSTEERYRWLRTFEMKNLVVPLVGDFAGNKAIRSVGEYVKQRGATVTAFYTSNVEQYLFTSRLEQEFYRNVSALPTDSTSRFIRALPGGSPAPRGDVVVSALGAPPPPPTLASTSAFISGIAPINRFLEAFAAGRLQTYQQLTAATKSDDWKSP